MMVAGEVTTEEASIILAVQVVSVLVGSQSTLLLTPLHKHIEAITEIEAKSNRSCVRTRLTRILITESPQPCSWKLRTLKAEMTDPPLM